MSHSQKLLLETCEKCTLGARLSRNSFSTEGPKRSKTYPECLTTVSLLQKLRPGKGQKRSLGNRASEKALEKADRAAGRAGEALERAAAGLGADSATRKPSARRSEGRPQHGNGSSDYFYGEGNSEDGGDVEEEGEGAGGSGRVALGCPMAVKPSAARMFQRQRNKHRRLFDGDKTGLQVCALLRFSWWLFGFLGPL